MATVQVYGGNFQDESGNPLALGYLLWEITGDEQTLSPVGQICSGIINKVFLDNTGNIPLSPPFMLWPNNQLSPANSQYIVRGYKADGQLVWGPNYVTIPAGVSYDAGNIVPTNTYPTGGPTPLVLTPKVDVVIWWPSTVSTSQNLLHWNNVHGISFSSNFSGSAATCLVAPTATTTINVNKNGVTVGTIVFAAGGHTGTLTCSPFTMANGDYLDFIVVAGDVTFANIAITLSSTRTS